MPTSRAPAVSTRHRSADDAKTPAIESKPSAPTPVAPGPGVLPVLDAQENSTISPTPLVVPTLTLAPSAAPSLQHVVVNDLTFYIFNIDKIMEENERGELATFLRNYLNSVTFVEIESMNITSNRVFNKNKMLEIKVDMKAYPIISPITPTKEKKLENILLTHLTHPNFLHKLQKKIGYFELACKVLENLPKNGDVCGVSRSESLTSAPTTVPPTTSSKLNSKTLGKNIWSFVGVVILFSAVAFVVTGVWWYKKYRPWSFGVRSHRNHQRGAFTFKKPFKKSASKKEGFFYSEVAENISFPRDPFEKPTVDEVFKPSMSKKSNSRSLPVSGSRPPSSLQVSTDSSSGTRETPQQWIPFPPAKEPVVRNVIPPMIVVQNIDGNDSVMSDFSRTISPTMSELTVDLGSGGSRGVGSGRVNRERAGRSGSLSSMSIFQNEVLGSGTSSSGASPGADGKNMMTGRSNYLINPHRSRSLEFNQPKRPIPAVSIMKSRSYETSHPGFSLEKNLRKEAPPPIYTYRDDLHKVNREVAHHKRLPPVKPPRIVAMPSVLDTVLQPHKPIVPSASISVASAGSGATDQSSGRVRLDLDDSTMNDGTASIGSTSSRISQTSRSITSRASAGSRNLVTRSRASKAGRALPAIPADPPGQRPPTSKGHRRTVSDDSTVCGYRYTFHVPSSGTLGIIIEASRTNQPTIYQVKDHSPLRGKVEKGDRIVMVGNVSTFGMRTADVTARLKKERRRAAEKELNIRITVECEKEKKGHRDESFKRKRRKALSPLVSEISDDMSRSIKQEKVEKMRVPSSRIASPMLSEGRIRNERLVSSQ